jgi:hypothetical protein
MATQVQVPEYNYYRITATEADDPCHLRVVTPHQRPVPSLAMERGTLLHGILKQDNQAILRYGLLPDPETTLQRAWNPTYHPETLEAPSAYDRARESLIGYREYLAKNRLRVIAAEKPIETLPRRLASIPRLGVYLSGRIDAVLRRHDGGLVFLDFKTGRYLPSEAELADLPSSAVYTLLARHDYGQGEAVEIAQLRPHTGLVVSTILDEDTLEAGREVVRRLVVAKHEGTALPTPGPYCISCPLVGTCPAHQVPAGEQGEAF